MGLCIWCVCQVHPSPAGDVQFIGYCGLLHRNPVRTEFKIRMPHPPPEPAHSYRPSSNMLWRILLRSLCAISLALGVTGIFIPGLPTTVFILIAAWAAARSSPRVHEWLWRHKVFGPMLRNWHEGGTVSRKAKYSAAITMAFCAIVLHFCPTPLWTKILAWTCMLSVSIWLTLRPEPQKSS